jgi:hypothetical protein
MIVLMAHVTTCMTGLLPSLIASLEKRKKACPNNKFSVGLTAVGNGFAED